MRAALSLTVSAVLLGACADRSSDSGPVTFTDSAGVTIVTNESPPRDVARWHTEPLLTIGQLDGGEEYAFGEIADVAVDRRGRVLVLDRLAQQAMAYDAAGSFLFRMGGPGEGPGELSREVMAIRVGRHDSIAILDYRQTRLSVYGPNGAPARTVSLPDGRPGPYEFHALGDGRLLVRWFTYELDRDGRFVPWDALLLSDTVQESFDTLMLFDYRPPDLGGLDELRRPVFTNAAFYDLLTDGGIVWSALEAEQIAIHAADGSLERIVRNRGWRRQAASAAERETLEAVYRARPDGPDEGPVPDNITLPDSIPTITAVRASGDGGFWVQRLGPLSEIDPGALFLPVHGGWLGGTTWEVYDRDGRWRATVQMPKRFRVTRVRDSTVVGIHRDELDVERVMVLRVVW